MQLAQTIHAAGESSSPNKVPGGTYAVALEARDSDHLEEISSRLSKRGITHTCIHEPDPPYNGALLSIGVCPGKKNVVGRYLSDLPLVRDRPPVFIQSKPPPTCWDKIRGWFNAR